MVRYLDMSSILEGLSPAELLDIELAYGSLDAGAVRSIVLSAARARLARRLGMSKARAEITPERRRAFSAAGARSRWRKPPPDV